MVKNADGVEYATPYAVLCRGQCAGPQCLSEREYMRQLSDFDARWRCPNCEGLADWDDDCPETNPAEGQP